jgi:hypothetical protein
MSIGSHGHEHELEPQYGLPELLPAGEHILWQGAPDFASVALRVFQVRKAAIYFATLLLLRAGFVVGDGGGLLDSLYALAWPLPLALTALASLTALAWMTARTTVYTLTDKRVVMRIGIVLTLTCIIPFRTLRSSALRSADGRTGDIVMQLAGPDHIAFLHLWPHVRPWRLAHPEPMLRAVPDAPRVAMLLAGAWAAVTGVPAPASVTTVVAPAATPASAADTAGARTSSTWQPSPT